MRSANIPRLISNLLLLVCFLINPVWAHMDTLRTFPEKRFVNGGMAFEQHMAKNLRYPPEAMQGATVGIELVTLTIAPTGQLVNVAIVNSLGKVIDREVVRVIQTTRKTWLPADPTAPEDSIMLFLPVKFTLEDQAGDNAFFVEAVKPDFILSEIVLVGYSSRTTYGLRKDAYYIQELSTSLPKNDHKHMLECVNELIRRNPYSDKLYLQRAQIEQKLGQTDKACSDYKKIIYFLGRTRFPKHFVQNCPD